MRTNVILSIIYRIVINVIALGLAAFLFRHAYVTNFWILVLAAVILTALNWLVKPILMFISMPVVILTLGLGYFIVNALIIMLLSWLIKGYVVDGFWTAVGVGLVVTIVNMIFDFFTGSRLERKPR